MDFVNRALELQQLERVWRRAEGGLIVVFGRRRVGKTRLLLEWMGTKDGVYWVADLSAPAVQRQYFARTLAEQFPGFEEVEYPDWRGLLSRLAKEASVSGWRGPLIIDELPYLVAGSPELPTVLQHWIDHEARASRLVVAIAGSSQRMMQGMTLEAGAPLYGRAAVLLRLPPISPAFIQSALGLSRTRDTIRAYTLWGGIPRYWELAADFQDPITEAAGEGPSAVRKEVLPPGPLLDFRSGPSGQAAGLIRIRARDRCGRGSGPSELTHAIQQFAPSGCSMGSNS